jgi:hypothetical protein
MDQNSFLEFPIDFQESQKRADSKSVDPLSKPDLYRSYDERDLGLQKLSLSRGPSRGVGLLDAPVMRSAHQIPSAEVRSAEIRDKPTPVPDLPAYYEARSSFSTENVDILADIHSFLLELRVEAHYTPKAHRIDCSACSNNNSAFFVVALFKATVGQYVVELQRRSGCAMLTRKMYSEIVGHFEKKEKPKAVPSWGHVELDDETSEILVSMASNSGSDQQREAFRLLCDIAGGRDSHDKILSAFGGAAKVVSLVSDALNSGDLETERYVCIFLANMCCGGSDVFTVEIPSKSQSEMQRQFVEKLFIPISGIFTELERLGSLDSKKQVLRCMDSLPAALAREVKRRYSKTCRDVPSALPSGTELSSLVSASYGRFLDVQ